MTITMVDRVTYDQFFPGCEHVSCPMLSADIAILNYLKCRLSRPTQSPIIPRAHKDLLGISSDNL